jgi:hypothetical protein
MGSHDYLLRTMPFSMARMASPIAVWRPPRVRQIALKTALRRAMRDVDDAYHGRSHGEPWAHSPMRRARPFLALFLPFRHRPCCRFSGAGIEGCENDLADRAKTDAAPIVWTENLWLFAGQFGPHPDKRTACIVFTITISCERRTRRLHELPAISAQKCPVSLGPQTRGCTNADSMCMVPDMAPRTVILKPIFCHSLMSAGVL